MSEKAKETKEYGKNPILPTSGRKMKTFQCRDCPAHCEITANTSCPPAPVRPIICPFGGGDLTGPDNGFKEIKKSEPAWLNEALNSGDGVYRP